MHQLRNKEIDQLLNELGTGRRLLIVEDDPENQKFLEIFLGKYFEIELCDSEESFYKNIKSSKFDIILMNISIRGRKSGLELTTEIRKNNKFSNIPIVGHSAHARQIDRIRAIDAGCNTYLVKPINIKVLLRSLVELVLGYHPGYN